MALGESRRAAGLTVFDVEELRPVLPDSDIKASLDQTLAAQQAWEAREARELDLPRGCRLGAAVLACLLLIVLVALAVGTLAVAVIGWRLILGGPL